MSLTRVAAPTDLPITVAQAKFNARISNSLDDDSIIEKIESAVNEAEHLTKSSIMPQIWQRALDCFPIGRAIRLGRAPVTAISSIKYTSISGSILTISPLDYSLDNLTLPGWVTLNYGKAWPSDSLTVANAVVVTFVTGYADAGEVPAMLKQWLYLKIGELYETRERSSETPVKTIDWVDRMLDPFRVPNL